MVRTIGLVSKVGNDGLSYVYLPGQHNDLIFDQRRMSMNEQFALGDFISFIERNGFVIDPEKHEQLMRTRVIADRLLIQTHVQCKSSSQGSTESPKLVWSPSFEAIECMTTELGLNPGHAYVVWIERISEKRIDGQLVSWRVASDQPIAPWNDQSQSFNSIENDARLPKYGNRLNRSNRGNHGGGRRNDTRRWQQTRPLPEELKTYKDNYVGLVIWTDDNSARVWSLAIPVSEIIFMFGAREGLKVGDWIQFNCDVCVRALKNCCLEGKKYELIEPVLRCCPYEDTVVVEVCSYISDQQRVKKSPNNVFTIETEHLGLVEFFSSDFIETFRGKYVTFAVTKCPPSELTGAIWKFHSLVDHTVAKTFCGVVTQEMNKRASIWTKEVGIVQWAHREDSANASYLGEWLKFKATSQNGLVYSVIGTPKKIESPLETKVKNNTVRIKTAVHCPKYAPAANVRIVQSPDLGRVELSGDLATPSSKAVNGCCIVWAKWRNEVIQWEVTEIIEYDYSDNIGDDDVKNAFGTSSQQQATSNRVQAIGQSGQTTGSNIEIESSLSYPRFTPFFGAHNDSLVKRKTFESVEPQSSVDPPENRKTQRDRPNLARGADRNLKFKTVLADKACEWIAPATSCTTNKDLASYTNRHGSSSGNRAEEYWKQAWQIPRIREEIAKSLPELYENLMKMMSESHGQDNAWE